MHAMQEQLELYMYLQRFQDYVTTESLKIETIQLFCNKPLSVMRLDPGCIDQFPSTKFLHIFSVSGRTAEFDIDHVKRSFYAVCICIFNHSCDMCAICQGQSLAMSERVLLPSYCFTRLDLLNKSRPSQLLELNVQMLQLCFQENLPFKQMGVSLSVHF